MCDTTSSCTDSSPNRRCSGARSNVAPVDAAKACTSVSHVSSVISPRSSLCHGWSVSSWYGPTTSSRLPPPDAASAGHGDVVRTPEKSNRTASMEGMADSFARRGSPAPTPTYPR